MPLAKTGKHIEKEMGLNEALNLLRLWERSGVVGMTGRGSGDTMISRTKREPGVGGEGLLAQRAGQAYEKP